MNGVSIPPVTYTTAVVMARSHKDLRRAWSDTFLPELYSGSGRRRRGCTRERSALRTAAWAVLRGSDPDDGQLDAEQEGDDDETQL